MKPYFPILVILLLFSTSFVGMSYTFEQPSVISSDRTTLYVDGSEPLKYKKIQDGINGRTSEHISNMKNLVPPFKDPPNLVWNKTLKGKHDFLLQTSDNGYILVGGIYTSKWNVHLVKTDINGNEEWNKTFEGPRETFGGYARETADGGYIMSGYYDVGPEMADIWLIKTDGNGDMIWDKKFRFGGYIETWAFDRGLIVLDDGYLILATIIDMETVGFENRNIWLIKTDFDGNELWNKTVGGKHGFYWPNAFIMDTDGNIVITGYHFFDEVFLIKTDLDGNRIWRKTFNGNEGDDIKECDDGGYIISDAFSLIKTDRYGNKKWRKTYDYYTGSGTSVDITSDGGFVLVGTAFYNYILYWFMIKTDKYGNREWEKSIATEGGYKDVIQSNDGNYVAVWSDNLVKVSPFENQRPIKPSKIEGPICVKPWIWYNYTTSSSDPDGEIVYYRWENIDFYDFEGPYNNNETCEVSFYWFFSLKGKDKLTVKARDIYGGDSEWVELEIRITLNKAKHNIFLLRLFERLPLLQRFLGRIFV
jgi:hypothetical protein